MVINPNSDQEKIELSFRTLKASFFRKIGFWADDSMIWGSKELSMYRFLLSIALIAGLSACANNDKKISSWEVNDVYQSTMATPNNAGGKTYVGPSINTMDESNTYEMFNLRTAETQQGGKTYELQVHLTYFNQARDYNAAYILNKPADSFKLISKEAGLCQSQGCTFKELVSITLTDAFLKQKMNDGFQINLSSKSGINTVVYIPPQYIKGYLMAVDGAAY
jgi:hypothetical protein